MERYPQATENVAVDGRAELTDALRDDVERANDELGEDGRVLVRPSGTEPVVRVLAEASTQEAANGLCASIAALVARSSADRTRRWMREEAGLVVLLGGGIFRRNGQ